MLDAFALLSNSEKSSQESDGVGAQGGAGLDTGGATGAGSAGSGGITFEGVRPPAHEIQTDDEYERQLLGYHHSHPLQNYLLNPTA